MRIIQLPKTEEEFINACAEGVGFGVALKIGNASREYVQNLLSNAIDPETVSVGAVLDVIRFTLEWVQGDGATWKHRSATTCEGLASETFAELPPGTIITREVDLWGVFCPGDAPGALSFYTPLRRRKVSEFGGRFYSNVSPDEWQEMIRALVLRNHAVKSPIYPHPCPECLQMFTPKRRGQVYHSRNCAATAGERRRHRRKNPDAKRRERKTSQGERKTSPSSGTTTTF